MPQLNPFVREGKLGRCRRCGYVVKIFGEGLCFDCYRITFFEQLEKANRAQKEYPEIVMYDN